MNSLMASAMAGGVCRGLQRLELPSTFRSMRVRNATAKRIGTISSGRLTMNILLETGVEPLWP